MRVLGEMAGAYHWPMNRCEFKEGLLRVMERKVHWSWPAFTGGQVAKELLHIHLEQEYGTYVRDYPILVARAYVQCPVPAARRVLAETIYERETGGLSGSESHAALFLEYPRGLGMNLERFRHIRLLPAAARFRALLDEACCGHGWEVAAAVTMIFLEGSEYERGVLEPKVERQPQFAPSEHPLVKYYGLPVQNLALSRIHRQEVGRHRKAAWHLMLDCASEAARPQVLQWMGQVLHAWYSYRDEVAEHCGLVRAVQARH
ncbi:iron-containing redox enzyme family protein [Microbulbifer thermotolerans]|uniref:Iron-containing redox enzyme family protein n=1 Tax=Microbulbifer thermotolerans TaxID=252514 RepID=A0AB35HZB2_MICTH|nr:iron-containing redox enzyme family protein [Microbulbifer thermotolerans]MCX2782507.1 iron-containing redox enzyme family protein [Microbulbifer thermotolerans]MCX2802204.1 iron-containing redox enzyme family protein [Microbulbifer thermotolerans]MCX2836267.1 iron-containing redox enzyme family protein [Microbulbifer thermotolerans]MCX2840281.1 iron-containing redox enzyme family protein [Microbulbifer thermotolerans]SFB90723.1 pyrroloquinoline-quinone synthase [Microbulbifer thermotoleran